MLSPRDPRTEQGATNLIHATKIKNCQRTFVTKLGILPGDYARRDREPPRGFIIRGRYDFPHLCNKIPEDHGEDLVHPRYAPLHRLSPSINTRYQAKRSTFHRPVLRRSTWYPTNRARSPDVVVALG
ncbi:endonuclease V-like [Dorcoceras hygrometricum]|uniref:Endonuclease V-like n=1 Tax=Dorcoceras hygrometricum TaxID=472368 RepID=A0A2Z7B1I2_9LAMI|nr:endonuclease V-like [Dorcoceras hygrometricum]